MKKLKVWYRKRRFLTAYKIIRNEAERHQLAGHTIVFSAVNSAYMTMVCRDCPNLFP